MKLLKGILCVMLAAVMTLQAFAVSDMPADWAKAAVEKAVAAKIINVTADKVRSGDNLKRWELGFMLSAAFGATQAADLSKFTDMKAGGEGYESMAKAVKMGLFTGEGSLLRPNDAITRQEAFAVLARALGLKAATNSALDQYTDKLLIADWAKPELSALTASKIISGSGGKLNPTASITRKEFCQVLYNLFRDYHSSGTLTAAAGGVVVRAGDTILKNMTINGDLVIGDGVGSGLVTLDNVVVTGRIIVRSGNLTLGGVSSKIESVYITNAYGKSAITISPELIVGAIEIRTPALIKGACAKLILSANQTEISGYAQDVQVNQVADLSVKEGSLGNVVFEQSSMGSKITLDKDVTVQKITANAGITVLGLGSVCTVLANANSVSVQTPNSTVSAQYGTLSVVAYRTPVAPGFTVATNLNGTTRPYTNSINSDIHLSSIKVGGKPIANFSPDVFYYAVAVDAHDAYTVEMITASSRATVTGMQPTGLGKKATFTVTAPDGATKMAYTIYFYKK